MSASHTPMNRCVDQVWWKATIESQLGIILPDESQMQQWSMYNTYDHTSYSFEDQWVSLSWDWPYTDLHVIIKGPRKSVPNIIREYKLFDII